MQALRRDDLVGERLELTGPESLTQHEMVAAVGTATGRSLRYEEVPPDAVRQATTSAAAFGSRVPTSCT